MLEGMRPNWKNILSEKLPMETENLNVMPPMLFLAGPPGVGKTALGRPVCAELGLRFLDLAEVVGKAGELQDAQRCLKQVIDQRAADVVELPWRLQLARATFALCRRHGELIGLWAHPLDMQARSGHAEPLFTPNPDLKTQGGFGLRGTRCPEFKRINRGCQTTLPLVGLSFEEALEELKETIRELHAEDAGPGAEREKLMSWAEYWQLDLAADKQVTEALVDAMARYTWHLKTQGASPRAMSSKYDDLNALGYLMLAYDEPKGKDVLSQIRSHTYEYSRKMSDSPRTVARYNRTVEEFRRFLRETRAKG
jgi:hypothetical protein